MAAWFFSIVALTLWLHLTLVSAAGSTCYWQNSTQAPTSSNSIAKDDVPCFPNLDQSPCCASGWTCLSDGVCSIAQNNNTFYYRGTCTDATWGSNQCPGWCFAQNSNTSIPLAKCSTSGADTYCCPGDPNCDCNSGSNVINLGQNQPTTVTVIGATSWPGFNGAVQISPTSFVSDGTSTGIPPVTTSSASRNNNTTTSGFTNSTKTNSTAPETSTKIATMTMSDSSPLGPITSVVVVTASSASPTQNSRTSTAATSSASLGSNIATPIRQFCTPLFIAGFVIPAVFV